MDRLLTAEEIAERLGMKTQWVWAQARAGGSHTFGSAAIADSGSPPLKRGYATPRRTARRRRPAPRPGQSHFAATLERRLRSSRGGEKIGTWPAAQLATAEPVTVTTPRGPVEVVRQQWRSQRHRLALFASFPIPQIEVVRDEAGRSHLGTIELAANARVPVVEVER